MNVKDLFRNKDKEFFYKLDSALSDIPEMLFKEERAVQKSGNRVSLKSTFTREVRGELKKCFPNDDKIAQYANICKLASEKLNISCGGSDCNDCRYGVLVGAYNAGKLVGSGRIDLGEYDKKVESETCNFWKMPNSINAYLCGCNNKVISNLEFEYCPYCGKKINVVGELEK